MASSQAKVVDLAESNGDMNATADTASNNIASLSDTKSMYIKSTELSVLTSATTAIHTAQETNVGLKGDGVGPVVSRVSKILRVDPRGLGFAPPEVREMIFKLVFASVPAKLVVDIPLQSHQLPALLLALKDQPWLFQEAVAVFGKMCKISIKWAFRLLFYVPTRQKMLKEAQVNASVYGSIRRLEIFFGQVVDYLALL